MVATQCWQGNPHNNLPPVVGADNHGVWLCVGGRLETTVTVCVVGKLEAQTGKVEDLITCICMDANMVEAGIGKQLIYMNL